MLSEKSWKRWAMVLVCGAALFFLYLFGLNRTGLLSKDEPRYAAIGQAMAKSGDWVTPRLWGDAWFEKPALLYWMTAIGFKAGLDEDLAPRLPVALASVGFLIFFFFELRRQFDERTAFYASAILATSAGWLAYSHVAVTDLPMSAAFAAAMLLFMNEEDLSDRRSLAAGALLGLAVLGKGLVPLVLFAPALWFLRRRTRVLLIVFSAGAFVSLPWYVLVTMRNGAPFLQEFFLKQQLQRLSSPTLLHERPFWFYVPALLAGLFPWTLLLVPLFYKRLYSTARTMFLLAWFAWGFVFFSISLNKLPGYLLPLLPALAALMGIALARSKRPVQVTILLAVSAALLGFIPAIQSVLPQALVSGISHVTFQEPLPWILPALMGMALCAALEWQGQRSAAVALIALLTVSSVVRVIWETYPILDQSVSMRGLWRSHPESVVCVDDSDPSRRYGLNYYAGRQLPECP